MQNPILWDYKIFGEDESRRLHMLLLPRDGRSVAGMRYAVRSRHPFGVVDSGTEEITSEVVTFARPSARLDPELYLWDREGRLLEARPLSFWGKLAYSTWEHRDLPDGSCVPVWPEKYYEDRGKTETPMERYERERMYRRLEEKGEFFYFKAGERERATDTLGKLLASAGLAITVCDMYLDAEGLKNCVCGWSQCRDLTLLASKKRLVRGGKKTELEEQIDALVKEKAVKTVSLYGISGGPSDNGIFHDRFVILDGVVYCVGGSLNGLGVRDTVLFRSPNPAVFTERVEELKKSSAHLLRKWGEEDEAHG